MKLVYILLGILFLVIGAIGVLLPILPTTPFLLLSSVFFTRSSDRLTKWFHSTKLYQHHLKEFVEKKELSRGRKIVLTTFATTMLLIGFFTTDSTFVKVVMIGLILFLHYYFWFVIQTKKRDQE